MPHSPEAAFLVHRTSRRTVLRIFTMSYYGRTRVIFLNIYEVASNYYSPKKEQYRSCPAVEPVASLCQKLIDKISNINRYPRILIKPSYYIQCL